MRFNRVLLLIVPTALVFMLTACDKDDIPEDSEKPVMSISLPTDNQVIDLSLDSMHIMLNITDNDKLKSFTATLTANGVTLYSDAPADAKDKNYYIYHRHFNPPGVSANMSAELTLVAEDRNGNTESRTIDVSFVP